MKPKLPEKLSMVCLPPSPCRLLGKSSLAILLSSQLSGVGEVDQQRGRKFKVKPTPMRSGQSPYKDETLRHWMDRGC